MGIFDAFKKKETLNERIKKLRKEKGLTQLQLGDMLHITDKAVSKWESGEGNPDISILPSIAAIFDVTVDYLLTGVQKEPEIIAMNKMELCCKKNDIELFNELELETVKNKDENAKTIIDYIKKYDADKVFIEMVHKYGAVALTSNYQSRDSFKFDDNEIISLMVQYGLNNELESIGFFTGTNKSVRKQRNIYTKELLLKYLEKNSSSSDIEKLLNNGSSDDINLCLECAITLKNAKMIECVCDYILSTNKSSQKAFEERKKACYSGSQDYCQHISERGKTFEAIGTGRYYYFFTIGVSKENVISLIKNNYIEYAKKLNEIVHALSNQEMEIELLKTEKNPDENRLKFLSVSTEGLINFDKLLETHDLKFIKDCLDNHPVHAYELLEDKLQKKEYRYLFRFATDYQCAGLINAIKCQNDDSIEKEIRNLFSERYVNSVFNDLKWMNSKWFNKVDRMFSSNISYSFNPTKLKELFNKTREEVYTVARFEKEKSDSVGELTNDYFSSLMKQGNYELIIIKLCVKLEAILKYDLRYTGTFEEMLNQYCQSFNTRDDEANNYDPETPRLLNKLRIVRNGLVHADKVNEQMSKQELECCINHIFRMR